MVAKRIASFSRRPIAVAMLIVLMLFPASVATGQDGNQHAPNGPGQPLDLAADPTIWEKTRSFRHPESGRLTELAERFEYDPIRQVLLVESELRTEGAPRPLRVPLIHRQWFPRELEALLHYNGFVDIRFTADFTDLPPDDHVDSLVISCRVGPLR